METKICVIGLGYVGLPLARLFSTKYKTIGFDMNPARVDALMALRWKFRINCSKVRYGTTVLGERQIWKKSVIVIFMLLQSLLR